MINVPLLTEHLGMQLVKVYDTSENTQAAYSVVSNYLVFFPNGAFASKYISLDNTNCLTCMVEQKLKSCVCIKRNKSPKCR